MMCRAVDASACAMRIAGERKTIRVESPERAGETASAEEIGAIDGLLDRVSGAIEPVGGDGSDPGFPEDARGRLVPFSRVSRSRWRARSLGSIAAYTVKDDNRARLDGFRSADKPSFSSSARR